MSELELVLERAKLLSRIWTGLVFVVFGVFGIIMSCNIARPGFAAPEPTIVMSLCAFVIGWALYGIGVTSWCLILKDWGKSCSTNRAGLLSRLSLLSYVRLVWGGYLTREPTPM